MHFPIIILINSIVYFNIIFLVISNYEVMITGISVAKENHIPSLSYYVVYSS